MTSFIVSLVIVIIVIGLLRKPQEDLHSHWGQLLSGFKFSTKEFYKLLKEEMINHEVHDLSFEEVSLKTGSIFSSERVYLRIKWQDFRYDLCFAPFGDGCFVSWWLIYETSEAEILLAKIPLIGSWLRHALYRQTYYKIDTASMFMTYSQHSVLSVIDEITKASGIRLTEAERRPTIKSIFER
jgi:hypothetical protein